MLYLTCCIFQEQGKALLISRKFLHEFNHHLHFFFFFLFFFPIALLDTFIYSCIMLQIPGLCRPARPQSWISWVIAMMNQLNKFNGIGFKFVLFNFNYVDFKARRSIKGGVIMLMNCASCFDNNAQLLLINKRSLVCGLRFNYYNEKEKENWKQILWNKMLMNIFVWNDSRILNNMIAFLKKPFS